MMYWNITALTRMGSVVTQNLMGSRREVMETVRLNGLEVISINADLKRYIMDLFKRNRLSAAVLSGFFKDFSRCLKSGLSAREAIVSLDGHTANPLLQETLKKINASIVEGCSFREAFEATRAFPPIVLGSMDAAEKTGHLAEVALILSEYFKFMVQNKARMAKSLVYPASVFIALTAASIIISIKLVPQLSSIVPAQAMDRLPARLIIGYAGFMQSYWWMAFILLIVSVGAVTKMWELKSGQVMRRLFHVPGLGPLIKEMELAVIFLNLYVYQKSGVNIISSLDHICSNQSGFIAGRLKEIKDKVSQGYSLGEALKTDGFFPSFISMSVKKGEATGNLHHYFYEIYQYYDQKSRDSMELLITFVNPALLLLAVSYLGLIIYSFILPLYSSMSARSF